MVWVFCSSVRGSKTHCHCPGNLMSIWSQYMIWKKRLQTIIHKTSFIPNNRLLLFMLVNSEVPGDVLSTHTYLYSLLSPLIFWWSILALLSGAKNDGIASFHFWKCFNLAYIAICWGNVSRRTGQSGFVQRP